MSGQLVSPRKLRALRRRPSHSMSESESAAMTSIAGPRSNTVAPNRKYSAAARTPDRCRRRIVFAPIVECRLLRSREATLNPDSEREVCAGRRKATEVVDRFSITRPPSIDAPTRLAFDDETPYRIHWWH